MAEVEETIKRLLGQKGVIGVLIMDTEGRPIRSTLDQQMTSNYAMHFHQLTDKATTLMNELDTSSPNNDLQFIRVRAKKHELMIAPDKGYFLCVVANPNE